ncbi:MAG: exopolysaccharide Pel transporter PelG [Planctomycetota bacterium]
MAGIGFELRRLALGRFGLLNKSYAYACAGLISSGPWILTVITLVLLNIAGDGVLGVEDSRNFRALVTSAFALSLLTVGLVQMPFTRFLSDLLYVGRHDQVLPSFTAAVALTGAVQGASGLLFCTAGGFDARLTLAWTALYVVVSIVWLAVAWLTVVRQYGPILLAFIAGMLTSLVSMYALGPGNGIGGAVAAYGTGQALTLALLCRLILRGTAAARGRSFDLGRALRQYPRLVFVGFAYSAAIWVDKVVFWYSDGIGSHPLIRFHPLYDTCCFLAYLSVVPALAINLVHFETGFYQHYRGYYAAITQGMPLREVAWRRKEMTENLWEGAGRLVRVQGAVTLAVILLAPQILDAVAMPPGAVHVFRVACLGAFFHVGFLITSLLLLYFDLQKDALSSSVLFLVLNATLSVASVKIGFAAYGSGYALAALVSLVVAFAKLTRRIGALEYETFATHAGKPPAR